MKVYLAHPYALRLTGLRVKARLEELGFEVLNPFESKEERSWFKAVREGRGLWLAASRLVDYEVEKIESSDLVVALRPELGKATNIELYVAWKAGVSVYIVTSIMHPFYLKLGVTFSSTTALLEFLRDQYCV